jgi:hypothetical protein
MGKIEARPTCLTKPSTPHLERIFSNRACVYHLEHNRLRPKQPLKVWHNLFFRHHIQAADASPRSLASVSVDRLQTHPRNHPLFNTRTSKIATEQPPSLVNVRITFTNLAHCDASHAHLRDAQ